MRPPVCEICDSDLDPSAEGGGKLPVLFEALGLVWASFANSVVDQQIRSGP